MQQEIKQKAKDFYPDKMGGLDQASIERYRAGYMKGYKDAKSESPNVQPVEQKENEAVGKFLEWLYDNDITRHSNGHWYKWDNGQAKEVYYANDIQHITQLYNKYKKNNQ